MRVRIGAALTALVILTAAWVAPQVQSSQPEDPDTRSTHVVRASRVIGMDVYNKQDVYLGEIEELVLNRQDGDLAYAVLNYGGVWGFGGKYLAVPFDRFDLDVQTRRLTLDTTKAKLDAIEGFEWNGRWPDDANWR